jgi:hypothetical protein
VFAADNHVYLWQQALMLHSNIRHNLTPPTGVLRGANHVIGGNSASFDAVT